jgi:hypothetical protein
VKFRVSNLVSRFARPSALFWLLAIGCWPFCALGAEDIPPLAPPLPEIQPSFLEEHPMARVAISSAITGFLVGLLALWMKPRKPPVLPAPAAQARNALKALQAQPESGAVLSQISQILRRYLINTFWLPPQESTTSDFCRLLAAHERIGPVLAEGLGEFLRACDERKFSPATNSPPLGAAGRALELVEVLETARVTAQNAARTAKPA